MSFDKKRYCLFGRDLFCFTNDVVFDLEGEDDFKVEEENEASLLIESRALFSF
jgi:hypothetical protein